MIINITVSKGVHYINIQKIFQKVTSTTLSLNYSESHGLISALLNLALGTESKTAIPLHLLKKKNA